MTTDHASDRTRMVVLAMHVVALLGGVAYAWGQWANVSSQQAAVDQIQLTVAELDARLAHPNALSAAVTQAIRNPFVPGTSATLAAANLQDRVVSAVRAVGGTVTSSQVDTGEAGVAGSPAPGPPAIRLTVSCQLGNAALQALLYGLETDAPALFLDQLTIESDVRGPGTLATGSDTLKISMMISGFWTAGEKS